VTYDFITYLKIIKKKRKIFFLITFLFYSFFFFLIQINKFTDVEILLKNKLPFFESSKNVYLLTALADKQREIFREDFKKYISVNDLEKCGYEDYENFINQVSFIRVSNIENSLKIKNINNIFHLNIKKCQTILVNSLHKFIDDIKYKHLQLKKKKYEIIEKEIEILYQKLESNELHVYNLYDVRIRYLLLYDRFNKKFNLVDEIIVLENIGKESTVKSTDKRFIVFIFTNFALFFILLFMITFSYDHLLKIKRK